MRSKNLIAAALSGLALCAVGAETASADSISYIKDGNVWLSTPDGSRQFQVTDTGGYSSASQADNGTIVALKGQRIHKLDRLGNVQADITTAVSDGTDDSNQWGTSHFVGPYELDLSPDGSKVSYNFHWQHWTNFGSSYSYHYLRQGVGVSHVDRTTSWDDLGYQTGWLDGTWYDNDTLAYGYKANSGMVDIAVNDVGRQNTGSQNWFKSDAGTLLTMRSPAVSTDKSRIAVVGDSAGGNPFGPGEQLWTVAGNGEAPRQPAGFCNGYFGPDGGKFTSPTFSPDSRSLAWGEGNGIWVAGGQQECVGGEASRNGRLVIPGGKDPDWSAADVPTGRPVAQQPGGTDGDTKTTATPAPAHVTTPTLTTTPQKSRVTKEGSTDGKASRSALTVAFPCKRACSVIGKVVAPKSLAKKLKLGGAALATGKAKRTNKGSVTLELELTAKGRAAAARLKGRKLTLRVTIKEGGKTRRLTRKVTLG